MDLLKFLKNDEKKYFQEENFSKNEILFMENDKCEKIGFILEGNLIINTYLNNGTEIIYKNLKENDYFGNHLIFTENNKFKGNIQAKTNCKIAFITQGNFLKLLSLNNGFLENYLKMESENSKESTFIIKINSLKKASDRLDYLFERFEGKIPFKNITDISKKLFLTRESTSRLINSKLKINEIEIKNNFLQCKN